MRKEFGQKVKEANFAIGISLADADVSF